MDTKKDFGAAVKQKLDSFKDSPDDMVWTHIEAQLKKKKKRRIFILLFSGLGLSALLLVLWIKSPLQSDIQHKNNNSIIKHQTTETSTIKDIKTKDIRPTPLIHSENKDSINTYNRSNKNEAPTALISKQDDSNTKTNTVARPTNFSIAGQHKVKSNSNTPKDNSSQLNQISKTPQTTSQLKLLKSANDSLIAKITTTQEQDSVSQTDILDKLVTEDKTKDSLIEDNASRWSVTPHGMLTYYGALSSTSSDNFSFDYGLLLSYKVSNHTYLRFGVRPLNLKQRIEGSQINIKYLEFPLDIKYAPFNNNLNPYFTGGINYFVLQSATINGFNNPDYNTTFGLHLGVGAEYEVFKKLYLNIESNFNYQIKPISDNSNINPFILSVNTGIEYRF